MAWTLVWKKRVEKQIIGLPEAVQVSFRTLVQEIEVVGPVRGNWKNYGKLSSTQHHCHLKSGRPTYVVCWEVVDKRIEIVEIYYVGTHEKAPY